MSGLFILSLDVELAWGTYGPANVARLAPYFDGERDSIRRLLALLDQVAIPATWAVVGHLMLDRCDGHPDVLQPHYAWSAGPDAARDPCSDIARAPRFYAPDVIALIRAARVPHEIGSHTFTHVIAADPAVTPDIWHSQMAKCAALHAEHGLPLRSIVYPQNRIAYVDTLPQYGITAYRGQEQNWYARWQGEGVLGRVCHLIDRALGLPPPTYDPAALRVGERLVNLPASQFLMGAEGVRRFIPVESRVQQARLGLDRAVTRGQLFHLWFHPFNLGTGDGMFPTLERILQDVARRRDAGDLRVMTMAGAAEWILSTFTAKRAKDAGKNL